MSSIIPRPSQAVHFSIAFHRFVPSFSTSQRDVVGDKIFYKQRDRIWIEEDSLRQSARGGWAETAASF